MSDVADKLREARVLVEKGWTQGWFAQTANGTDCMERDTGAVCWCASGAIWKVAGGTNSEAGRMLTVFMNANNLEDIANWNDAPERTQAEVVAAFDRAIELAEQSA